MFKQAEFDGHPQLDLKWQYRPLAKELPRVDRAQGPVEDQKSQLLRFSEILLEVCSILVKVYKHVHFTEFHSIL